MVVDPPRFTCRTHLLYTETHNILVQGVIEVVAKGESQAKVTMCTYFTVGHMQSALQLFRHALHCCSRQRQPFIRKAFYQPGQVSRRSSVVTTDASSLGLYAQFDGCQVFGSRTGARQAWLINHLQLLTVCLARGVFHRDVHNCHVVIQADKTEVV